MREESSGASVVNGARDQGESWVSAVREWSEKSESEWGERMSKCKWGESRVGRV